MSRKIGHTRWLESAAVRLETLVFDCFIQKQTEEFYVSCFLHREHYVKSDMRHRSVCRGRTTSHCCYCYCFWPISGFGIDDWWLNGSGLHFYYCYYYYFLFHAAYTANTVRTLECAIGLTAGGALRVTVATVIVTGQNLKLQQHRSIWFAAWSLKPTHLNTWSRIISNCNTLGDRRLDDVSQLRLGAVHPQRNFLLCSFKCSKLLFEKNAVSLPHIHTIHVVLQQLQMKNVSLNLDKTLCVWLSFE